MTITMTTNAAFSESTNPDQPTAKEIFDKIEQTSAVAARVKILQDNDSQELRFLLQAAYDNNVKWLIPDGEPPFNQPKEDSIVPIFSVVNDFPKLLKYGPWEKTKTKFEIELFFIRMLESLDKDDAKMLIFIKDQKLSALYKKLTKKVVSEYLDPYVKIA